MIFLRGHIPHDAHWKEIAPMGNARWGIEGWGWKFEGRGATSGLLCTNITVDDLALNIFECSCLPFCEARPFECHQALELH